MQVSRAKEWLAVDAVTVEPFSTANSLLTGKLAGNIDDSAGIHF
jgi:hypothetical protein